MFFRQFLNDDTACASYLFGCKSKQQFAVVDPHVDLVGEDAARVAMRRSVATLTSDRIRDVEQVIVAEKPAETLLQVAGENPASLIVVNNRGLSAAEGEILGSVPAEIVKNAVCDVTVIQTSGKQGPSPTRQTAEL